MLDSHGSRVPPLMPLFRTKNERPTRLHVGSGKARLEGWVNLDVQALPGVDVVADVTQGLQYSDVEAIYAEHFLEHLAIDDAVAFLAEAHRALAPGAWLRLSTPNLDWVWVTHYGLHLGEEDKRTGAIAINRAFHGWRHRFLWNRELLGDALAACGFAPVRWCRHGESELPVFQGIERHEAYVDTPELPHVIIAEAAKGEAQPERLAAFRDRIERDFLSQMAD
ncbi:MAG TPA: methyltransferase domain-containing protein [Thermoanaerobaculia bacterium]